MNKVIYIVYKTTGPNNLYYIGVHKTKMINGEIPFDGYIGCGITSEILEPNRNTITRLGLAVYLTGYKNWVRETLFTFDTELEAYQKEEELVSSSPFLDNFKCLNQIKGGVKSSISRESSTRQIAIYDNNGDLVETFQSIFMASLKLNINENAFNRKNEQKRLLKGLYRFLYFDITPINKIEKLKRLRKLKPVAIYDIHTKELVSIGFSSTEAAIKLNLSRESVARCSSGFYKTIANKYVALKIEDINTPPMTLDLPDDYFNRKPCGRPTHKNNKQ